MGFIPIRGRCHEGNKKVIEYLNKALRHAITAVSQYWLHYRLLQDWGFAKYAKKGHEESVEEMQHADKRSARRNASDIGSMELFKSLLQAEVAGGKG